MHEAIQKAETLLEALGYVRKFRHKLVVIKLGTNDLKQRFSVPAYDIADGAGVLVDLVRASANKPGRAPPKVLLIAPAPLAELTWLKEMFAGGKAGLRPIYDQLLALGLGLADDVKASPCTTIVPLYRHHVFAELGHQLRPRQAARARHQPRRPRTGKSWAYKAGSFAAAP